MVQRRGASRRGALELSVTGVVVLIIAIVVLGSVIYFIRTFFGSTGDIIGSQLQQVKDKLREDLQSGSEAIVFDFGRELKIKKGSPMTIYLGLRNDYTAAGVDGSDPDTSVCYVVQWVCLRSFSGGKGCPLTMEGSTQKPAPDDVKSLIVGGAGSTQAGAGDDPSPTGDQLIASARPWVSKGLTLWDIPNRGSDVNPVTFQVTDADPDTYQMELRVFRRTTGGCADYTASESSEIEAMQPKRFLIELQ